MATKEAESTVRNRSKVSVHQYPFLENYSSHDNDILKKRSKLLLPQATFILLGLFYAVLYLSVYICDQYLPSRPSNYPRKVEEFNEIRAYNFMRELASIGPRPTGSYENEILAVDYLNRQLKHIKDLSLDNVHKIEIDLQKTNGSFPINFMDGMTSSYQNVKNIIAKIGPHVKKTKKSILINCHFDSVPTSPGASDDAINCAIMLETLRVFSRQPEALDHDVIFLFNGAEENILQGAHGFITQHPWARNISAFINLEACGAGGREMLFQADKAHTWLLDAYARGAPYPFGSIMAQEIFQSGLIPSDTDFRIFRDFGHLPGLDFAFASNGYVYHTRFDSENFVTSGSLLRAGENLLGLVRELQKSPYTEQPELYENRQFVYFDFLGLFMVIFPLSLGQAMAGLAVIATLADILYRARHRGKLWSEGLKLGVALLSLLLSLVAALLTAVLVAKLLEAAPMAWFAQPRWIAGLYLVPSVLALVAWHRLADVLIHQKGEEWLTKARYFDAARLLFVLLTCVPLAGVAITSTYFFCFFLIFPTAIRPLGAWLWGPFGQPGASRAHALLCVFLMQVVPTTLGTYTSMLIFHAFVPIMGRIGTLLNSDIIIGVLTAALAFLNTLYTVPVIHVIRQTRHTLLVLLLVASSCIGAVLFTPMGFPFSDNPVRPAPQRYFFVHVSRTFYNQTGQVERSDTGYWTAPVDHVGTKLLQHHLPELLESTHVDCDQYMYCGMAYYLPVSTKLRHSYYLPADPPRTTSPTPRLRLDRREGPRLHFTATGSTHISMVLWPRPGVTMPRWSLGDGIPVAGPSWQDHPTYFLYLGQAEPHVPWHFWLDLESNHTGGPQLDVVFISHYIHGPDSITGDFSQLLTRLPAWTHAIPWTALYQRYIF